MDILADVAVDRVILCSVCGGPIRPPAPRAGGAWNDGLEWQTKVVLLSDPDDEFETLEQHYRGGKRPGVKQLHTRFEADIRQDLATATWANTCVLKESEKQIVPHWSAGYDEFQSPYGISYSIANHEACVEIAVKVMRKSQNDVCVQSLRTLWKVLRSRYDAQDNEYMGTVEEVGDPQHIAMDNGYYMPNSFIRNYSVRRGDDTHWVVADPLKAPLLTSQILSNIETLEPVSANAATRSFQQLFLSLPQELQDRVVSFMGSPKGLPIQCTGLLPQETWLGILLGGRYLPFLWDLDTSAIETFHDRKIEDKLGLNWELLVRKLSVGAWMRRILQVDHDLFCYPGLDVPGGLRNRRRIWQLVEEMFVGDYLPSSPNTMPRYWDDYGGSLYPVERVSETQDNYLGL